MAKKLKSIFTDRMNQCIVTHALTGVEIHHVFGGANRKLSEKYDFCIEVAQIGDRDSWYREFGRFWDDRCDENVYLNKTFEWRLK